VARGEEILSTLNQLAALAAGEADVDHTAERVVQIAIRTVECDVGGLTVFKGRRFTSMAASDPIVERADRLQYELGEGPCVEAAWEQETFVSNDLALDSRWPSWGPKAAALGLGSLLAARMSAGDKVLGALNLYARRPREFTSDEAAFAHIFATHATATLLAAREIHGLRLALDARTLIGQAQGILMERYGLDETKAFAVLRRYSQDANVKLREVAEVVISTRRLPAADLPEADPEP
jgi:GAF domain-containing protein